MVTKTHNPVALRLLIGGRVQGVGFRPFVYRLAHHYQLQGWVKNRSGQVEIHVQGSDADLSAFRHALLQQAPPLSRPELVDAYPSDRDARLDGFAILASEADADADIHLPADYFACEECLAEVDDTRARRYRYPFTNCTQCGPRYTLIRQLPYDRPYTAMADFPLCPDCEREYRDPLDRRFHAQPLACPRCGPRLSYRDQQDVSCEGDAALAACIRALGAGRTVAVKGVGGYHLLCDARADEAVLRLRQAKHRPDKPLAVMFPQAGDDGLDALRRELKPSDEEASWLCSPMRPIVLVKKRDTTALSAHIAPGLNEVGALLPYSPLHHLLLGDFGAPLVATSGNISGEPVLTEATMAEQRLATIAEAFLHHNRPILRPADDPVYRFIGERPRALRLGRGIAPLELALPQPIRQPTLAVGGHMKNSIALAWDRRLVISPHIGDLESPRSREVFIQLIGDMQALYQVKAEHIVCDLHPGYASQRWARQQALPSTMVAHHHAHASALYGEHKGQGDWLVFSWDGVGLGTDGQLWGGEAFLGRPGHWRRVATLRPFRLPGGEKAAREPWRSALGLCWESGLHWQQTPEDAPLLRQAWEQGLNSPTTSAAGRLFDGAAALLGLCETASFEGQGPMLLEACAKFTSAAPITLPVRAEEGLLQIDWEPLLPVLMDGPHTRAERAACFHHSLAHAIRQIAQQVRQAHAINTVGLCGGVFQNRLLCEATCSLLEQAGFTAALAETIPSNDGGLCYGQIIEVLGMMTARETIG